jgi:hypothetical protein
MLSNLRGIVAEILVYKNVMHVEFDALLELQQHVLLGKGLFRCL